MRFARALPLLLLFSTLARAEVSVVVDGTLNPGEWGFEEADPVTESGEVLLAERGSELCLGLRASRLGMVNLLVWRGDEVRVLHRSGSLGRAVYQRETDGRWHRTEDFQWRLRGMGKKPNPALAAKLRSRLAARKTGAGEPPATPTPAPGSPTTGLVAQSANQAREAVAAHLLEHGWTAATGPMSAPHSAELCLSTAELDGWRMIVQWSHFDEGQMIVETWPAKASAAPPDGLRALLMGEAPESLALELDGGLVITSPP